MAKVIVRLAIRDDATEIARLLTLLGFTAETDSLLQRFEAWRFPQDHAFVATSIEHNAEPLLLGVITVHIMNVLHRRHPVGRITALIVDAPMRGRGIGRLLVKAAEDYFTEQKCGLVEITSNARLVDAHAFYERLGYMKTSVRLAKTVNSN